MSSSNNQDRVAFSVPYGLAPLKGSRAMRQLLNFSVENPIIIDLTYEQDSERIEYVQALYVDNSLNSNAINFTFNATQQKISIPAGCQGYIPVLASSDNCQMTVDTTSSSISIPIHYLSFPVPAVIWAVNNSSNGGSSGTDFSANKPALSANLLSTVPVNATRAKVEVENQSANQIQVVLDDGAGNNVSILLLAAGGANIQGASWWDSTFKGRLRVFSSSALDQVMVRET